MTPHHHATERRRQRGNQQAVIAARDCARDGAGSVTAEAVRHEPFAIQQDVARGMPASHSLANDVRLSRSAPERIVQIHSVLSVLVDGLGAVPFSDRAQGDGRFCRQEPASVCSPPSSAPGAAVARRFTRPKRFPFEIRIGRSEQRFGRRFEATRGPEIYDQQPIVAYRSEERSTKLPWLSTAPSTPPRFLFVKFAHPPAADSSDPDAGRRDAGSFLALREVEFALRENVCGSAGSGRELWTSSLRMAGNWRRNSKRPLRMALLKSSVHVAK